LASPPSVFVRSTVDEPEGDVVNPEKSRGIADVLDIDISAPLRTDEVLPELRAYGVQTGAAFMPGPEPGSRSRKKKKKEEKTSGKDKRKKKKAEPEPEPEPVPSKKKKEKKSKKDSKPAADDLLLDLGAPPAAAPDAPAKKEKKEKKSKKDKSGSPDSSNSTLVAVPSKLVPLCKNEHFSVAMGFVTEVTNSKQVSIAFVFKNKGGASVSDVSLRTTDSMNTRCIDGGSSAPFALKAGGTVTRQMLFSCDSFVRPQKMQGQVSYSGGNTTFQLVVPCSTFVVPMTATKEAFADAVGSPACSFLSSTKMKVPGDKLKWAIEAVADILHVTMIECVAGAASFYGQTVAGQPVAVLVKMKKSGLALEVRSFDDAFVNSLTAEASTVITEQL